MGRAGKAVRDLGRGGEEATAGREVRGLSWTQHEAHPLPTCSSHSSSRFAKLLGEAVCSGTTHVSLSKP